MSPEGERGNIDTSRIEIVTVKDFREAVIGFIKKRFSERYREEKIEALESLINEAEGWNQNL